MANSRALVKSSTKEQLKLNVTLIGVLLAIMWGIEILNTIVGHGLDQYGIRPREAVGLLGLVTSPFIHGGFAHLIANSIPFAVLGFFVLLRGLDTFIKLSLTVSIIGGLLVWLVAGSHTTHIGASGVIFGYFGYLLAVGVFERSLKSMAAAIVVGFIYGGMIFGVFPGQLGISWQGHLFGFLVGGGYGYIGATKARAAKPKSAA